MLLGTRSHVQRLLLRSNLLHMESAIHGDKRLPKSFSCRLPICAVCALISLMLYHFPYNHPGQPVNMLLEALVSHKIPALRIFKMLSEAKVIIVRGEPSRTRHTTTRLPSLKARHNAVSMREQKMLDPDGEGTWKQEIAEQNEFMRPRQSKIFRISFLI